MGFVNLQSARKQKTKSSRANNNEKRGTLQSLEPSYTEACEDLDEYGTYADIDIYGPNEPFFGGTYHALEKDWLNSATTSLNFELEAQVMVSPFDIAPGVPDYNAAEAEDMVSLHNQQRSVPTVPDTEQALATVPLPSSSTQLLNTSFTATTFSKLLKEVYEKVLAGTSSRFLDHRCNIFAGMRPYSLEDRRSSQSSLTVFRRDRADETLQVGYTISMEASQAGCFDNPDVWNPPSQSSGSSSASLPSDLIGDGHRMTMIGLVRFLDKFSDIYGNKLDAAPRKESNEALESVMQAFSLQWLPSSNSPAFGQDIRGIGSEAFVSHGPAQDTQIFLQAWFKARSCLLKARSNRSFTMVYAIFLFDMTVRPTGARFQTGELGQPHELLQDGLDHLGVLEKLVQRYCKVLGHSSTYASTMWSCLNVMRWFGFVRDTVSSFMSDRKCLFSHTLDQRTGTVPGGPTAYTPIAAESDGDSDVHIQDVCRVAMSQVFINWRRIVRLRAHLEANQQTLPSTIAQISADITSATASATDFELKYGAFLRSCQKNFTQLSWNSKTASAFVVIFSNLGLLVLAEQLSQALRWPGIVCGSDVQSNLLHYESTGISSIAAMVRCIFAPDAGDGSELSTHLGAGTSLMLDHINIGLVVLALAKSMEHSIRLRSATTSISNQPHVETFSPFNQQQFWDGCIKTLTKCMLSLDSTIVGSFPARTAFDRLVGQYGDIIMECWSLEDDEDMQPLSSTCALPFDHEINQWSLSSNIIDV